MNNLLGYNEEYLKERNGYITAKEICNQPKLWKKTYEIISSQKEKLKDFIDNFVKKPNAKVVITGAGSSAFVGNSVVSYLDSKEDVKIEAIATTDIVSHPQYYFKKDQPTLLISCARSGNSPESTAAVTLAEKLVDDIYHLVITCNPEGKLALHAKRNDENFLLLMPEQSNDKGFAMTGSFSTMLLSCLLVFNIDELDVIGKQIEIISKQGKKVLSDNVDLMKNIVREKFKRTVYLGAANSFGLAKESALKVLELTAGKIATLYDTPLGFRHGPKSIINDETLIIIFFSNDTYARAYEYDLLKEVHSQNGNHKVLAMSDYDDETIKNNCDYFININKEEQEYLDDSFLVFDYLLNAQMYAFINSMELGIGPDNPCPTGEVNRVVKGVIIHDYK
ncbi:tagatose-6-phosphate ketose isomerase [Clostridium botulinum]|uniref:Tagatose-6-phosphate ketose isomerase n=1 Tax=Clostridium botulinum C/D str. DC5 TaxID=1443128 RepID=A0A0A0I7Y0_CLOBO|nr:SIS domain-containing protein [Clostridium botulinum]KGM95364.1 tagatose-6-phosphate ketose isomerase [Clostridium botulinum D str. CCUG 7971]KGM97569.1 tagatose-6-phosphate ketose isomerase [Clostridium botulinum C/D str. DC5]KOC47522.1 tagatose-6-phosphate ketose isomerase [Clostridium botulinum]KOC54392.1 tagatose-6-phosphate ketose isomerase [Clostridium botulinum]KOC55846.1 tagatose-6-phosphate ketose isomerase [Clostridium botulinum]